MYELRIHGRGGQGAVVASRVLADALFGEGRSVQTFPIFGVERRGAPVAAFLRISEGPVLPRSEIAEPDACIVLDPALLETADAARGLKPGGLILVNTDRLPRAFAGLAERFRVSLVDAAAVARGVGLGSADAPIVNTPALGAFSSVSGLVGLESVCASIAKVVEAETAKNVAAAREGAKAAVKVGDWEVQHA